MPALGMTMEEGRVVAWLVKEGDPVARGQILLEIESEKVAYEVEAPADGVIGRILVPAEATVPVGTPLVSILSASESLPEPGARVPTVTPASAGAPGSPGERVEAAGPGPRSPAAAEDGRAGASPADRPRLSPRARKLADELGVDPAAVTGSGPGGTIVEKDIRAAAARRGPAEPPFVLHPFTSMRRTIAERMIRSAREAPHFFVAVEVDGLGLLRAREAEGPRIEDETGIKLTLTDLLLHATAATLARHRALNASWTPEGVREWQSVNLGLAVAVDDGLIVPVIRQAEQQSLGQLVTARADLVARARARKLTVEELHGGTFTLSNLGPMGIDVFTSILNPPESGILSVGALRERAVVWEGRVVARPTMVVGLTIDHRVTDGAVGARFLTDLRARIERGGDAPTD